jgi:hypothetical protein
MNLFSKILAAMSAFLKYAPYALAGAKAVESAVGAGNGSDKKTLVVSGILAAAHAGESVPVAQVQVISGIVETVVGVLNATGMLGKPGSGSVSVPTSIPGDLQP